MGSYKLHLKLQIFLVVLLLILCIYLSNLDVFLKTVVKLCIHLKGFLFYEIRFHSMN